MSEKNSASERKGSSIPFEDSHLYRIVSEEKEFERSIVDIFLAFSTHSEGARFKEFIEKVERIVIVKTLTMFNCNQRDAAKFLGINHTTLHEKVKRYKIQFQKKLAEDEPEFESQGDKRGSK